MTLTVHPDLEQRSDAWYAARCGLVTASSVGALLTSEKPDAIEVDCPDCDAKAGMPCVSKRKPHAPISTAHSPRVKAASDLPSRIVVSDSDHARTLTLVLAAERITGFVEPTFLSADMMRGQIDEPRALEVYAEHYAPVETCGFMVEDRWGHPIGYSPDALVGDDGLIEVKSRRQKKQLSTVLAGEIPAENMAQIQCGLLVSGRSWCDYVSYSGGMHLWAKRVLPDPAWHTAILAAVAQFEDTAAQMVAAYRKATSDLPLTERVDDLEMVI